MITPHDPPPRTALVMALHGDLDLEGAAELRLRLPVLLVRHQPLHVNLDLAQVMFLDCAGVRVLNWLDRYMREHGGTLTIVRPSRRVLRLLRLLRFDHRLWISQEDRHEIVPPESWRTISLTTPRMDHDPSLN
ncbi:STAS domain-containing protein [Sphaerisporangium sp. NPDC049002]|uniref:STAS domain-containing protein n=1 Tax=unclassified Sphaerisporangium TaxID=2630420 RepID=UPI0033F76DD2